MIFVRNFSGVVSFCESEVDCVLSFKNERVLTITVTVTRLVENYIVEFCLGYKVNV